MTKRRCGESLKTIVGEKAYSVWVEMLYRLVPDGRTHRLAPTIAAMLQYASSISYEKYGDDLEEGTAAYALYYSAEWSYEEGKEELLSIVETLLGDAKVEYKRTSSKGEHYNVAEEAIREYLNWYNMPWKD